MSRISIFHEPRITWTARIVSNAVLMHHGHCPISFRTVDPLHYKKAMLLFYEQNSIAAFKDIFIGQYEFAVGVCS
jgi:hypothetical protein